MPVSPGADRLNLEAADAYCRFLARKHYENFSIAERFVDRRTQRDLARIYGFCRTTDDLGDESPDGTALARLERWRDETIGVFHGAEPVHPVLIALQDTIKRTSMPAQPFLDLIEANVLDQHVTQYETWADLERYCRFSAAPVGRMVLRAFGISDPEAESLSDDVCIGLQLANHAQDVSRDKAAGRCYLVQTDLRDHGPEGAVKALVDRARELLDSGRALEPRAPGPLKLQLTLYRLGGLAICDAIESLGYKTEQERPSVSTTRKVSLVVRAAIEALAPKGRVAGPRANVPLK